MAVVKGGQLWLVKPLYDGEDPSVYKSDIGVSVPVANLTNAPIIFGLQFLYPVGPSNDIIEKGEEDSSVKPSVH